MRDGCRAPLFRAAARPGRRRIPRGPSPRTAASSGARPRPESAHHRRPDHVAGHADDEQLAEAGVEDEFGRHARVAAADDGGVRALTHRQLGQDLLLPVGKRAAPRRNRSLPAMSRASASSAVTPSTSWCGAVILAEVAAKLHRARLSGLRQGNMSSQRRRLLAARLSVTTSRARPGFRAALLMATAIRVAGSGPPSRCPPANASTVTSALASASRAPVPSTAGATAMTMRRATTRSSPSRTCPTAVPTRWRAPGGGTGPPGRGSMGAVAQRIPAAPPTPGGPMPALRRSGLSSAMEVGSVTTANRATTNCSAGANARCPPASRDRFRATGAPGEMDIRTSPISVNRGRSNSWTTVTAVTGTATSTREKAAGHEAGPRPYRQELAWDDAQSQREHHSEHGRDGQWRQGRPQPGNGTAHEPCLTSCCDTRRTR